MKSDKNILIAFILNFSFSIFEFIGGVFTNSVAIMSDSVHDIGDALSIGVSYFFEKKSKKKPDNIYTYGYIRYSVVGSLLTIVILLVGSILVIYNSICRIINPVSINYNGMIMFAVFGVIINFIAAYYTKGGKSLNQRSINLHMIEDVLGWLLVLIGAVIMRFSDIKIIDPILSIIVAVFLFLHAFKHLKVILNLFLEKVPEGISVDEVKKHLLKLDGVSNVHHIHLWSIDGYNNYATMHVVVDGNTKIIKEKIRDELKEFGIGHATIETETTKEVCLEENCNIKELKHTCHHHH